MINLALIGLGPMGRNYLKTVDLLPNVKISCICSKTKFSLNQFPKDYIKLTNYKKIINYQIDAVIIATPSATHFEIASFFLKRNTPILIEKPLTTNYQDALKLLKIQKKKKNPVLVGHTLLFHPAYQKIKQLLPKIGPIKSLKFEGANNSPRKDASVIYDWGSHAIAFLLDLLDSKQPEKIKILKVNKNSNNVINQASIQLLFPKKITANIIISWTSPQKNRKLSIFGKNGTIIFDSIRDGSLLFLKSPAKHSTHLNYSSEKPLKREIKYFLKLIKNRTIDETGLEFGVNVVKILSRSEQLAQEKN